MAIHPFVSAKSDGGDATKVNASNWNAKHVGPYSYLVNGGMNLWQRGAGAFTANSAYTADRWQINLVSGDTVSVTLETTVVPDNSYASLKCAYTFSAGTTTSIRQKLIISSDEPQHYRLRGAVLSASARVRSNVVGNARLYIKTDGTGGTTNYSTAHTGGSTFETLTVAGVTIPTDATYVEVGVEMKTGSATVYFGSVALCVGSLTGVDMFLPLNPAEDLLRCQRYYLKIGQTTAREITFDGYQLVAGNSIGTSIQFPVQMSVAATVTKNGTWNTTNLSGQPTCDVPGRSASRVYSGALSAPGYADYSTNGAGNDFTAEANP